jgi:hypothetical protein
MTVFARYSAEFPEQEETRSLLILERSSGRQRDRLYFEEHYCADPECDCQRVMICVHDQNAELLSVVGYDFLGRPERTPDGSNPFLEPGAEQPVGASKYLALVANEIERDTAYRERLRRHYREMKEQMRNPVHPLWPAVLQDRRVMKRLAQKLVRTLAGLPAHGHGLKHRKKISKKRR